MSCVLYSIIWKPHKLVIGLLLHDCSVSLILLLKCKHVRSYGHSETGHAHTPVPTGRECLLHVTSAEEGYAFSGGEFGQCVTAAVGLHSWLLRSGQHVESDFKSEVCILPHVIPIVSDVGVEVLIRLENCAQKWLLRLSPQSSPQAFLKVLCFCSCYFQGSWPIWFWRFIQPDCQGIV